MNWLKLFVWLKFSHEFSQISQIFNVIPEFPAGKYPESIAKHCGFPLSRE